MPNGDGHDSRELWERVRDMQGYHSQLLEQHGKLKERMAKLERENTRLRSKLAQRVLEEDA